MPNLTSAQSLTSTDLKANLHDIQDNVVAPILMRYGRHIFPNLIDSAKARAWLRNMMKRVNADNLKRKGTVVTGAASGIGKAMARAGDVAEMSTKEQNTIRSARAGAAASRGTGAAANLRPFRNIGPWTGGPRPARRRRDSARRWRCLRDRQEALEPALERLGPVHGVRPQLLGRQREHGPPASWRQDDLPADSADPSLRQGGKGLDVYHSTHHSVSVQPADSHRWGQVRPQGGSRGHPGADGNLAASEKLDSRRRTHVAFPTATEKAFGRQQWGVGPAVVVGHYTEKVTLGVFPQYFFGIGSRGRRSDLADASYMNLLYFMSYNLPNAWQIGFSPTVTYDRRASSGNKWNVPVGVTISKTARMGGMISKWELGFEYSVVSQDAFGQRAMVKLSVIPVIPSLIRKPLFGGR
jgi:hypothetical protein